MPWKELSAMDDKFNMINKWLDKEYTITELSEYHNVSRKTVYKWIERYKSRGMEGLSELSRAPHTHTNETPEEIVKAIVNMKIRKMNWGPKKILSRLRLDHTDIKWPADSTGSEILKRHGYVKIRKYRQHTPPYTEPFLGCDAPNVTWSADYKGQFRMGNGRLCYPLTISDNYSRYLLECRGLRRPKYEQTKPCFEWAFRNYGLLEAIRTDNGYPFASTGLGGLSRLSAWFIKLGIRPERISCGCPEQNGRHERMHRTLKQATAQPPKKNLKEQQKAFNQFRDEYNYERPHEALCQKPPGTVYHPSLRPLPGKSLRVEYNSGITPRFVHNRGEIKWKGNKIYLSEALIGEYVGLTEIDNDLWVINYSFYPLGILDEKTMMIQRYKVLPMSPD
jgi:transposase InsO family protein